MIRLFVHHPVEDYDSWKQVYDDFEGTRDELGVREAGVYRSADNPNDVTVYHDFDDMESAQRFAGDDRLRQAMESGGVTGQPELRFTEPA